MKKLLLIVLLSFPFVIKSQVYKNDELKSQPIEKHILKKEKINFYINQTQINDEDAGSLFNQGVKNMEFELYDEAISYFKKALKLDKAPTDLTQIGQQSFAGPVYLNLALCYYSKEDQDSAIFYSKKSLEVDKSMVNAYGLLAELYQNKNLPDTARYYYNKGLAMKPDNPDLLYSRAILELNEGNVEVALSELNIIEKQYPDYTLAFITHARIFDLSGLSYLAKPIYKKALKANPESDLALYYFALHCMRTGYTKKGYELLYESVKINPENKGAQFLLGLHEIEIGERQTGIERFSKAIEMHKKDILESDFVNPMTLEKLDILQMFTDSGLNDDEQDFVNRYMMEAYITSTGTDQDEMLEERYENHPESWLLKRMYLEYLIRTESYDQALEILEALRILSPESDRYTAIKAMILIDQLHFMQSAEIYQSLLSKDPTDNYSRFNYAVCLENTNQYKEAIEHFELILEYVGTRPGITAMVGDCYRNLYDYERADSAYRSGILGSDDANSLVKLAYLFEIQYQLDSAEHYYTAAIDQFPDEWYAYKTFVDYYSRHAKPESADSIIKLAFKNIGRHCYIKIYRGYVQQETGNYEEAVKYFNSCGSEVDDMAFVQILRFRVYQDMGNDELANLELLRALQNEPDDIEYKLDAIDFYLDQKRLTSAKKLIDAVLELQSTHIQARACLADYYSYDSAFDQAEALYSQLIEENPGQTWAYNKRASHYCRSKSYENALADQAIAVDLAFRKAQPLMDMGRYYYEQGNYELAIDNLKDAINEDSTLWDAYLLLSEVLESSGKTEAGLACLQKLISKNKYYTDAYVQLGNLYIKHGHYDETIILSDQFADYTNREDADVLWVTSRAYFCLSDFKSSKSTVKKALKKQEYHTQSMYTEALAYLGDRQEDKAEKLLKAIRQHPKAKSEAVPDFVWEDLENLKKSQPELSPEIDQIKSILN